MVAANRSKSADKQEVCRKVTSLLKKAYSATPPKQDLPVLETLLYAVCLENSAPEQAGGFGLDSALPTVCAVKRRERRAPTPFQLHGSDQGDTTR